MTPTSVYWLLTDMAHQHSHSSPSRYSTLLACYTSFTKEARHRIKSHNSNYVLLEMKGRPVSQDFFLRLYPYWLKREEEEDGGGVFCPKNRHWGSKLWISPGSNFYAIFFLHCWTLLTSTELWTHKKINGFLCSYWESHMSITWYLATFSKGFCHTWAHSTFNWSLWDCKHHHLPSPYWYALMDGRMDAHDNNLKLYPYLCFGPLRCLFVCFLVGGLRCGILPSSEEDSVGL